ncbi:protein root initiation defective 3 [Quercus suber]|uniref:Protein root initiation defective 3 n=1 Tax=Quercus suber TaxID=58331 RepID=A0AAW0IUI7_QUESU
MSSSSPHEIVLTSSPDGPIIAYDASSGALLAHFTGTQTPRQGLTLVGNSTLIAASHISSATASGSIHLYNWWSSTHGGAIMSLVMMNEGQNLISAAEDGSVWVWEAVTGQVIMALQNEMGSISHMVVATGRGARMGSSGSNESTGNWSLGLSGTGRELSLQVKQTQEMEDMLTVVAKDRSKAIDMLESAIEMYERLLELILKEAKKGTSNGGE